MRSGYHGRKGFISLTIVGVILLAIVGVLAFTFFGGGEPSSGLFGWSEIPILAGIESFVTTIYNIFVFVATWIAIGVLGIVFLGLQIVFLYLYYRLFGFVYAHKDALNRLLDMLTEI